MDKLWSIMKDGLRALVVWAVVSAVLIYFLGYAGLMLSELVGMIFLVAFVALRFTEIAAFVIYALQKQRPPPAPK